MKKILLIMIKLMSFTANFLTVPTTRSGSACWMRQPAIATRQATEQPSNSLVTFSPKRWVSCWNIQSQNRHQLRWGWAGNNTSPTPLLTKIFFKLFRFLWPRAFANNFNQRPWVKININVLVSAECTYYICMLTRKFWNIFKSTS